MALIPNSKSGARFQIGSPRWFHSKPGEIRNRAQHIQQVNIRIFVSVVIIFWQNNSAFKKDSHKDAEVQIPQTYRKHTYRKHILTPRQNKNRNIHSLYINFITNQGSELLNPTDFEPFTPLLLYHVNVNNNIYVSL